jgi:hypothetical protein
MTDGYPELFNRHGDMMGYDQTEVEFKKYAQSKPNILLEHLTKHADSWLQGVPQYDDITFLVIKRKPVKVPAENRVMA